MSVRRVMTLLGREMLHGPKNFIFLMALVVPVALTVILNLVFGAFFSGQARLGLVDQGSSQLEAITGGSQGVRVSAYASTAELEDAVRRGAVDLGVALPAGFDQQVETGELARMTVYVWGESLMQDRIILSAALINGIRQIGGQETPVEIVEEVLGAGENIPWEKRLLPLLVLMTILMGGTMVPSTSLVNEKTKRTLSALNVSPATLLEVFAAKGLLGALLSIFTGVLILLLNRSFGGQPLLLVGVLALGAVFAASIGVLLGAWVKDLNTLFATVKGMGILLYAPGIIYMFPEIPQWIGRLFPTYYVVQPVLEISQNNAGLSDVYVDVLILAGLVLVSFAVIARVAHVVQEKQAAV